MKQVYSLFQSSYIDSLNFTAIMIIGNDIQKFLLKTDYLVSVVARNLLPEVLINWNRCPNSE